MAAKASHIWWGVSVENRPHGLPRIDHLRAARPQVAFLSIEPLFEDLGVFSLRDIHWVIVGGESGPGARPLDAAWVRSVPRSMSRRPGAVFLQTVGRRAEEKCTAATLDGQTTMSIRRTESSPVASLERRNRYLKELVPV